VCTTSGITHKFGNYIILGVNEGKYDGSETWIVAKHMAEYEKSFQRIFKEFLEERRKYLVQQLETNWCVAISESAYLLIFSDVKQVTLTYMRFYYVVIVCHHFYTHVYICIRKR